MVSLSNQKSFDKLRTSGSIVGIFGHAPREGERAPGGRGCPSVHGT